MAISTGEGSRLCTIYSSDREGNSDRLSIFSKDALPMAFRGRENNNNGGRRNEIGRKMTKKKGDVIHYLLDYPFAR